MAELITLLRGGKRLITLTGPGGVGKTRLTVQIMALIASDYPDGIWFADLAAVRDTIQFTNRVAETLGVAALPEQNVDQRLLAWLYDKRLLVVLDNVEQVPDAAKPISTWLRDTPGLTLLATSRIPLEVIGEQEYPIKPLSLPNLQLLLQPAMPTMAELQQSDAMALFALRVRDIHPDFAITQANQAEVAGICWRLDGLPLALELAAAWTRVFTLKQLLAQLQGQGILRFLKKKTQKLPPRQQTMYETLAWSYNLLQPPEQTLLSRLAAFGSGWTLHVAELICADQQGGAAQIEQTAIVHLLARLVEHNLVHRVQNESVHPRFILLEMVREFAQEQLELRGESEWMHRRHAHAYFAMALQAREHYDHGDVNAFAPIHEDLDSLRAALAWALEHGMIEDTAKTIIQLAPFWSSRMPVALPWIEGILARANELPPALRANILALIGSLSWEIFRNPRHASAICEACLAIYRELQDHRGTAMVLTGLAHIAVSMGQIDRPQTEAHLAESLALRRMLGDQAGIAETLSAQGRIAALYGDGTRAQALMQEALHIQRALGAPLGIAVALYYLAWFAFRQGQYAELAALSAQRLELEQAMGNPQGIADCTLWLGVAALWHGDSAQATQRLALSLQQLRALGDPRHLPHVLDACAHAATMRNDLSAAQHYQLERIALLRMLGAQRGVAWSHLHLVFIALAQADDSMAMASFQFACDVFREQRDPYGPTHLIAVLSPSGDTASLVLLIEAGVALAARFQFYEHAIRLAGAADAVRTTLNIPFYYPDERDRVTATVAVVQPLLAPNEFALAWAAGQTLSLEQAVAEAFALPSLFPTR
jgi:predicted ATPase